MAVHACKLLRRQKIALHHDIGLPEREPLRPVIGFPNLELLSKSIAKFDSM